MARLPAFVVRPADPDRVLLGRWAAARDEPAFAELVRRHGPTVWGVSRRGLANPADAEDAFQAAFLVLARRAGSLPPGTVVGAWLHRAAVLTCRNVRRAARRRPTAALTRDIAVSPPDPLARLVVDDLLNRLPERDRRAVVLCHLQGFSRAEAAAALGVPEGTLSARLSRGLARLRGHEAALAVRAVPTGLGGAAVRAAGVWTSSGVAGLSPATPVAVEAATGVLRMYGFKKLLVAACVAAAGLVTTGVGVGLAGKPAAADPPPKAEAKPPADGWRGEAVLRSGVLGEPFGKLSARIEKGWVVARYEVPPGQKAWEVVLAQATRADPPELVADTPRGQLTVEYGRYFIRDGGGELRVLRQRKAPGLPQWPDISGDAAGLLRAQTPGLRWHLGGRWAWVTAGPFGGDFTRPPVGKADVCLRLCGRGGDAGGATTAAADVCMMQYGRSRAADDGELFVASYNTAPPEPAEPKAAAPTPATPPPAKPEPPAVDEAKLGADLRKAFAETVPVCITGSVRDAAGRPVRNATVSMNGTVGYAMTTGHGFHGHARTDAAGRYAVWFRTRPGTTVVVTDLGAAADGFVAHRERFVLDQVKAHPDAPGEWDFALARGELLAGTVPAAAGKAGTRLLVRGPSFSREEHVEADGKFRLWVPAGRYTLTAVLADERTRRDGKLPEDSPHAYGQVITKSAVLRDVPSGSDGLVVK